MIKNFILFLLTENIEESELYLQAAKNKFIETFIGGKEND